MDINDIYDLIPGFQCLPGCTECCRNFGVPSRTRIEDERIKNYLQSIGAAVGEAQGTTCPYVCHSGCRIYPVRPLTCRLYGTSPNSLCQLGARPVRLLHADEEAEIYHLYQTYFF
ncbi:YkgJ family cysteine cluster protein [Desulfoferrobacter suflitae]|uniref:YkgJ family cysteine cluster protein n=1 Tax=Desulfoferrobacter suflitae TaxID=2865782 RepID=UPI0021649EF6|nr:YkgJ family cysteine cluster protein [Desulfoferrobacter suflitae]MCK8600445.1 YkgJ family cysteine cluster protein [Desulfoferrobacter suflitae]